MNILFLFYANFVTDSSLGDIQVSKNTHTLCSGSVLARPFRGFLKLKAFLGLLYPVFQLSSRSGTGRC